MHCERVELREQGANSGFSTSRPSLRRTYRAPKRATRRANSGPSLFRWRGDMGYFPRPCTVAPSGQTKVTRSCLALAELQRLTCTLCTGDHAGTCTGAWHVMQSETGTRHIGGPRQGATVQPCCKAPLFASYRWCPPAGTCWHANCGPARDQQGASHLTLSSVPTLRAPCHASHNPQRRTLAPRALARATPRRLRFVPMAHPHLEAARGGL